MSSADSSMPQLVPADLEGIETFEELAARAVAHLEGLAADGYVIVQVCGPISTGGLGSIELNNARFELAIVRAQEQGLAVFNQMPFQDALVRLSGYPHAPNYNELILEKFYRPVFECGHVRKALFLPDWQSSHGATWERELATALGLEIEEYPEHWLA